MKVLPGAFQVGRVAATIVGSGGLYQDVDQGGAWFVTLIKKMGAQELCLFDRVIG